jgi:hypothetical protein
MTLPCVNTILFIGPPAQDLEIIGLVTSELLEPYQAYATAAFEAFDETPERNNEFRTAMFGNFREGSEVNSPCLDAKSYRKNAGSSTTEPISSLNEPEDNMAKALGATNNPSLDWCMKDHLPKDPWSL